MNFLLNYKSKLIFYIPIFIIILMLYRNSWFLSGLKLGGKEVYIVLLLTFLLFLTIFDFYHLFNQNLFYYVNKNLIFIILFLLLFISTFFLNYQELTKKYYLARYLTFFAYFIIYFVIFPKYLFQNRGYLKKFLLIVIFIGTFTGFLAIILLFFGLNPSGEYHDFAIAYIWHPNISAFVYVVSVFATIFYYNTNNSSTFQKFFFIFILFIQLFALIFTYCRAGMIGVAIGISSYLFLKYKYKFILFTPIIILSIYFLVNRIFFAKGIASAFSRSLLILSAIHMITQSNIRLLWGYGITNAFSIYQKFMIMDNIADDKINNPHNMVLSLIMMFGIVFTMLLSLYFIFILIKIFKLSWNAKSRNENLLFAFLFSSMVALVVHNFFDSQILQPEFFCMQYFLIYLGISNYYIKNCTSVVELTS